MSGRVNEKPEYRLTVRDEDGHNHVSRTNDVAEIMRRSFADLVTEYRLTGRVTAMVMTLGGDRHRVVVRFPFVFRPDLLMQIGDDFENLDEKD